MEPGKRYYFSCKIKSTETRPGVLLYALDEKKVELPLGLSDAVTTTQGATLGHNGAYIFLNKNLVADPEGFNTAEVTFTAPKNACYISVVIDFSYNALGKAWFDDFQLLPLD